MRFQSHDYRFVCVCVRACFVCLCVCIHTLLPGTSSMIGIHFRDLVNIRHHYSSLKMVGEPGNLPAVFICLWDNSQPRVNSLFCTSKGNRTLKNKCELNNVPGWSQNQKWTLAPLKVSYRKGIHFIAEGRIKTTSFPLEKQFEKHSSPQTKWSAKHCDYKPKD